MQYSKSIYTVLVYIYLKFGEMKKKIKPVDHITDEALSGHFLIWTHISNYILSMMTDLNKKY